MDTQGSVGCLGNKPTDGGAAFDLHLSQQERQSEGLRGQVAQGALCWAGETGHTHRRDVKHRLSVFKQPTRVAAGKGRKSR